MKPLAEPAIALLVAMLADASPPVPAADRNTGRWIVRAVTHYRDPAVLLEVSTGLGTAMDGIDIRTMDEKEKLAGRGW